MGCRVCARGFPCPRRGAVGSLWAPGGAPLSLVGGAVAGAAGGLNPLRPPAGAGYATQMMKGDLDVLLVHRRATGDRPAHVDDADQAQWVHGGAGVAASAHGSSIARGTAHPSRAWGGSWSGVGGAQRGSRAAAGAGAEAAPVGLRAPSRGLPSGRASWASRSLLRGRRRRRPRLLQGLGRDVQECVRLVEPGPRLSVVCGLLGAARPGRGRPVSAPTCCRAQAHRPAVPGGPGRLQNLSLVSAGSAPPQALEGAIAARLRKRVMARWLPYPGSGGALTWEILASLIQGYWIQRRAGSTLLVSRPGWA